jgi:hypothetical protein
MNKREEKQLYQKLYEARRERSAAKLDLKKANKLLQETISELNETKVLLQECNEIKQEIYEKAYYAFNLNQEIFCAFGLPIKGSYSENLKTIMRKIKSYNSLVCKVKNK